MYAGRAVDEPFKRLWLDKRLDVQKGEGNDYKSSNSDASLSLVEDDCDSGHV
jgi:hypothetical protein